MTCCFPVFQRILCRSVILLLHCGHLIFSFEFLLCGPVSKWWVFKMTLVLKSTSSSGFGWSVMLGNEMQSWRQVPLQSLQIYTRSLIYINLPLILPWSPCVLMHIYIYIYIYIYIICIYICVYSFKTSLMMEITWRQLACHFQSSQTLALICPRICLHLNIE